jgi:hypothetical protein
MVVDAAAVYYALHVAFIGLEPELPPNDAVFERPVLISRAKRAVRVSVDSYYYLSSINHHHLFHLVFLIQPETHLIQP